MMLAFLPLLLPSFNLRTPAAFVVIFVSLVSSDGQKHIIFEKQTCVQFGGSQNLMQQPIGIAQTYKESAWVNYFSQSHALFNLTVKTPFESNVKTDHRVHVYGIKQKGKWMSGWLRVNIKSYINASDHIAILYIQAEDTGGQALGQFVHDFQCQPQETNKTKFHIFPCSAVPPREPIIPMYYLYIDSRVPEVQNQEFPFAQINSQREFNLYWRYSEFYCNALTKFRFRVHMYFFNKDGRVNETAYMAKFKWIGVQNLRASDPMPYNSSECDSRKDELVQGGTLPPWIRSISDFTYSYYVTARCSDDLTDYQTFSGRCATIIDNVSSPSNFNLCSPRERGQTLKDAITQSNYTPYDAYIKKRFEELDAMCTYKENRCNLLSNISDTSILPAIDPSKISERSAVIPLGSRRHNQNSRQLKVFNITELVYDSRSSSIKLIVHYRRLHGLMMIVVTTFILPLNNFMARYFKETFMNTRIQFCHVWYFVHCISIPIIGMLYYCAMWMAGLGKAFVGVSRENGAIFHRLLGYITLGIFICMALFGGVRGGHCLVACTFVHWFLGYFVYYLSLLLVASSALIPVSTTCTHTKSPEIYFEEMFLFALLSLVCDIVVHVIMTLHLKNIDKKVRLHYKRTYTPVPIPVMDQMDMHDIPGKRFRVIVLGIYVAICVCVTIAVCKQILSFKLKKEQGLGVMSCTHNARGNFLDKLSEACDDNTEFFL